jgi:hypothetical protein
MATEPQVPATPGEAKTIRLLPPPRLTGDAAVDATAQNQWAQNLFRAFQSQSQTINGLTGDAGTIDPGDLPDPATSSVAKAQATANQAYTLASQANGLVRSRAGPCGTVTIADAATSGTFTFPADDQEVDTAYFHTACPAAFTGSPAAGSRDVVSVTKATNQITITLAAAPGVGASVTFDITIRR